MSRTSDSRASERTVVRTRWPSSCSRLMQWAPMKPEPPVTRTSWSGMGRSVIGTRGAMDVRLREVLPGDLPIHFEQQRDADSTALAAVPPRDREAFDAHWAKLLADDSVVLRSILADGEVVGSALSFVRDGERHVGYWVGREHWGRGIASVALGLLLDELTERPLVATVATHNRASRRVLEKHGFSVVGGDAALLVLRLG